MIVDAPRRSVERLTKVQGAKLPRPIRTEILAHGAAAVAPLLDMLATGAPVAAGHAARLLGALKADDAVPALIRAVLESPEPDVVDGAVEGLGAFGAAAVEPALAALGASDEPARRLDLLRVLVASGVRDDRITAALLDAVDRDATRKAASVAARYGDPAVVDRIEALFRETEPTDQDSAERVIELGVALVAAGRFGDAHMEHMNAAFAALSRALVELRMAARADDDPLDAAEDALDGLDDEPALAEEKIGRNEPCWCGSGRKFKVCHGK